jgi:hypothetical protein
MTTATIQKTAVKPLNQYPTSLMTPDQTKILLSCLAADPEKLQALANDMESQGNFLWMVFTKRAKSVGLNLELNLVVFVVLGLLENPAMSTQMVHTIYHDRTRGCDHKSSDALKAQLEQQYTLNDFIMMFPMGLPSESSFEKAWDDQKQNADLPGGDNMLDSEKFYNVWNA